MRARELTADEAERPLGWRYPEPHATYDAEGPSVRASGSSRWTMTKATSSASAASARRRAFRASRRSPGTIDVGYGMRPELIGQGRGREFVGAILAQAAEGDPTARLRMSILHWNDRSRRVAQAHGFRVVDRVGEFDVLVRKG